MTHRGFLNQANSRMEMTLEQHPEDEMKKPSTAEVLWTDSQGSVWAAWNPVRWACRVIPALAQQAAKLTSGLTGIPMVCENQGT